MFSYRNDWILFEKELLVHRRHGKCVFRHFVDYFDHVCRSWFISDGIFQRNSVWHAFRASCRDGSSGNDVIQRDSRKREYVLPAVFNPLTTFCGVQLSTKMLNLSKTKFPDMLIHTVYISKLSIFLDLDWVKVFVLMCASV